LLTVKKRKLTDQYRRKIQTNKSKARNERKRFSLHCYGSDGALSNSAVRDFWPVEKLAQLADWPAGCGELAWGGRLCAWNFSVKRSPVFTEAEGRIRPNMTL
jgi:hypothetical protein